MGLVDLDYKIKYKHLFKKTKYSNKTIGGVKDEINEALDHFNKLVEGKFYAIDKILIPGKNGYLPRHGIVLEYCGPNKDFDKDFDFCIERIKQLANKLQSITSLYECPFKNEFCNKDSWIEYEGNLIAYNLSI